MRTGRWQRVAAAWAVRGQPYPAVGAELPVRFDLAAAIEALLDELVKLLLELQDGGLHPALLGLLLLFLVVHCVPSILPCPPADSSRRSRDISQGINLCPDRERMPQQAPRSTHRQPPSSRRRGRATLEHAPSDQVYRQKLPAHHEGGWGSLRW
jgi:hypothetical protein